MTSALGIKPTILPVRDFREYRKIRVEPNGKAKIIAVHGATGDLMQRFFGPACRELRNCINVEWWAIGRKPDSTEVQARLKEIADSGLPFVRYFQTGDFNNLFSNGSLHVNGAYIATPTVSHISDARHFIDEGIVTGMEKPITMPCERALANLAKLDQAHPNKIVPADFFMTSRSLIWVLTTDEGKGLLNSLGRINMILGRCIETKEIETHRPWIMKKDTSGGGLLLDMPVHPIAMAEPVLNYFGFSLDNATIIPDPDNVVLAKYNGAPGEADVESYGWVRINVPAGTFKQNSGQPIELIVDGGKGADDNFYGLKIVGDNAELTIGAGTEHHPPFVYFNPGINIAEKHPPKIFTFPGGGVGYGATIYNLYQHMSGNGHDIFPDIPTLKRGTINSVRLVGDAYKGLTEGAIKVRRTGIGILPKVPRRVLISKDAGGFVESLHH